MKKRIAAVVLTVIMLVCCFMTAYAAEYSIAYNVAYNSDKKVVTVTLFVENAVGLEAADLNLAYNTQMFEYVDVEEAEISGDAMVVAGKAETEEGLATCSLIFMESCDESMLDADGRLELATFTFMPRKAEYDLEDFCYWASSYSVNGAGIADKINIVGKQDLMEDKTDAVTYIITTTEKSATTKSGTESISGEVGSRWYVYFIAGVLAVGAIAGIAVVAIKSSHHDDENDDEKSEGADEKKDDDSED